MYNYSNFVISVRNVENGSFGNDPGKTYFLEVPDGELPRPDSSQVKERSQWVNLVVERATTGHRKVAFAKEGLSGNYRTGDVLVFVHGYNNSMADVMERHDNLQKNLRKAGFEGVIVSYDWPSSESTLAYLEDRRDARETAQRLVDDGIRLFANLQSLQDQYECDIDLHLLGHSTGAYVIREAFYLSLENRTVNRINWQVSQIALIGADIARDALSQNDGKSSALFQHSARITNYQNPFDVPLRISNAKRLGLKPRAGRVGIASDAPDNVVNVDVGEYWSKHISAIPEDKFEGGNKSHSWHFYDSKFCEDLVCTIKGEIDRSSIPTRILKDGSLMLDPS